MAKQSLASCSPAPDCECADADALLLAHNAQATARRVLEASLSYWAASDREGIAPPAGDLGDMHVLESADQIRMAETPLLSHKQRLRECNDDELCGCGSENRRYVECCKPFDQQLSVIELMSLFRRDVPDGFLSRRPPPSVLGFIEGRSALPRIADVHLQIASR